MQHVGQNLMDHGAPDRVPDELDVLRLSARVYEMLDRKHSLFKLGREYLIWDEGCELRN